MNFGKIAGKIFNVKLNSAEQKALEKEVLRQIGELQDKHYAEIDAMFIYNLYEQMDLTPEQCKEFYEDFLINYFDLLKKYEMGVEDDRWLFTQKCKDAGMDIAAWQKDMMKKYAEMRKEHDAQFSTSFINDSN